MFKVDVYLKDKSGDKITSRGKMSWIRQQHSDSFATQEEVYDFILTFLSKDKVYNRYLREKKLRRILKD